MDKQKTVLIVEDEKNIVDILRFNLQREGYRTVEAYDGADGLEKARKENPDLILLDVMLPKMIGFDVCKTLRAEGNNVPVIILTAREEESDKVLGLEIGADDYITKPFGTSELLARIRTALRHAHTAVQSSLSESEQFQAGDLHIDFNKHKVLVRGEDVHLTQNEYRIVALLARYSGRVITYDAIMQEIWGPNMKSDNKILRVNMANIRRKIEKNPAEPEFIFTEAGVGYRLLEAN